MDDIRIRLALDGADQVQAGANKVSAGLDKIGQSGQKVQAALSGQQLSQVSAQLQDFFVQLQGGQAPLTAFLQQGSQLSAVFGGVGNAARAVGSLITPMVAGLGALAGAVVGVGLAWHQGSEEAKAFNKELILSGNAAGVTVGQLRAMASAQSQLIGTQGQAADALGKLAGTGLVARDSLASAADAALRFARVGVPIQDTVKKFAELGKDPLNALIRFNETENFLTESVYKQVKALTEQRRISEAAALAQRTYAEVGKQRADELAKSLGFLERAWLGVTETASKAWDAMLNVGRPDTLQERAAKIRDELTALEKARTKSMGAAAFSAARSPYETALEAELALLNKQIRAQDDAAEAKRKAAAATKDLIAVDKESTKSGDNELQSLRAKIKEADAYSAALDRQGIAAAELTDGEKKAYELREQLKGQLSASARAEKQEALALAEKLGLKERENKLKEQAIKADYEATKARAAARSEARQAESKAIDAFADQQRAQTEALLAGIRDRTRALDDENAASVIARTQNVSLAEAINLVTQKRLQDKAAALVEGSEAEQAVRRELALRKELADAQSLRELNAFLDPNKAQTFGQALTGAFEQAGSALAKLSGSLQDYARNQREIAANVARLDKETDPAEKARKTLLLQARAQENTISLYANMAGAAKSFFNENTKGYKALEAAENAFRVVQLASDLQKGLSAAAVGVANQAQGDPYSAFPRMAAMAAIMAGLGFAVGGFGGGGSSGGGDGAPQATGTGTVLGDASAKSESIARATEQLASTAKLQLTTQSGMLAALRNIESNIGGLAALVVRGSALADSGVQQGTTLSLADPISRGIFAKVGDTLTNKLFEGLFGKKVSVTGQGLAIDAARLGSLVNGGSLNVSNYTDVNSKQKLFGFTVSNRNSTNYTPADPVLQQQFSQVFKDLYSGILSASGPLGLALDQVQGRLDNFVLNIGKIELKDLTGAQIQEKLQAVIGAAADNIATAAIPGLQAFQRVGEGYFETIVRVASGVETAKDALSRLGISAVNFADLTRKQGDVAAEIVRQSITVYETVGGTVSSVGQLIANLDASAEDLAGTYKALVDVRDVLVAVGISGESLTAKLIQGAGSLDDLASGLQSYLSGPFFSDQERAAAAMSQLQAQFARIGINTVPQSYAAFRALVDGIDDTTAAGQFLKGQLIAMAGAFDSARQAIEKTGAAASRLPDILKSQATERDNLAVELLKAQGKAADAAALKRAQDLATLTAGLTAEEAAAATAGYDYIASLRSQIDTLNAAAAASQQAAQAEAQRVAAVASQRDSIQAKIDDLLGNVAAQRARELKGLDESNRALQQRYYALVDEKAAMEKAQEEANKAAQLAADAAAEQARAAEEQLRAAEQLRDAWKSISNTLVEEAQRILGLDVPNTAQTLAQAQTKFAITTGQARAGDQDAAKSLPELARSIIEIVKDRATSRAELERVQAQLAASLQQTAATAGNRYGFTPGSSGTAPVDVQALLAQVAATAPITSAAAAPQQAAAAAQDSLSALVQEVRALRAEVSELKDPAKRTAAATERTRDTLILVTDNGNAMQVVDA